MTTTTELLTFTDEAEKIINFAIAWAARPRPRPRIPAATGTGTIEAAILMQLLHRGVPAGLLNQYAGFSNLSPAITSAGQLLHTEMSRVFALYDAGMVLDYKTKRDRWMADNIDYLPRVGSYMPTVALLYMALCKLSPLCGLYEPPSQVFTTHLLDAVGMPPLSAEPETGSTPTELRRVLVSPPRRRLY